MKALLNLFAPPSPSAGPCAVLSSPIELNPQELAAICDALQLLHDTRPDWLKPFTRTAKAKVETLRVAWRQYVREHS